MPTSSYTFKILLESKGAIAAAKRIRAQLEKELGTAFDFRQAKQQMAQMADLSQTTGAHVVAMGQGLKGVTKESGQLVMDVEQLDTATRQLVTEMFRAEAGADRLEEALRSSGPAVEEVRQKVKWLGRDLEEMAGMGRMERFGAAMTAGARQTYGARMLAGGMGRVGTGMMATGMAVVGPELLAARRWIEYTRDVSRSTRAMGLAREESEVLRQELIAQSVALGMISPEEMAEGLYQWVTGVGATAQSYEDLQQIVKDTIPLQEMAYLQGIDLATATEFTAGIMGEFGLAVSETERVVDILDATADRTFAQVTDLGEAFKMVGPIAHQLGISVEEMAAIFGVLSDANIKGTMAGRAMRQMLIRLTKSTEAEDEVLNKLLKRNEALGESWRDLAFPKGEFVGGAKWIDLLAAATENLTQEERAAALATISTANELPALTALITRQIEAREQGINIIRAEEKILIGVLDEETAAYAQWVEETTGNIMSLESAHEAKTRKIKDLAEEEGYQIDQFKQKWSALMLTMGQATTELALPALEKLDALLDDITEYAAAHPEVVQAAGVAGALITGIGAFIKTASVGIRLYADWQMIGAAATMFAASENMLVAAGMQQAATGGRLLGGLRGLGGKLLGAAGGLGGLLGGATLIAAPLVGFEAVHQARNLYYRATGEEVKGEMETLAELWDTIRISAAGIGGLLGGVAALGVEGADFAEGFEYGAIIAGDLLGLIEETTTEIEGWEYELLDATDEMKNLKEMEREVRREAQGLGDDLMQLPLATGGLFAFTEAELEAIDELEQYLRRRNEMVQKHNDDLAKMEGDFLDKEEEHYKDYLDKRADLLEEMRQVSEDPLWAMTKDVQKSERRIAKAIEDYNRRISDAIEGHQRKLRNLQEGHDDKMEGLEARRDARGIISERRRYGRAVRDAQEHHADLVESAQDRLDETIETEREKIETMRRERKEDLEEKLRELDENYLKEEQKRKAAHDKAYADRQQAQTRELQQLERAHAERLSKIMGWETQVRLELQRQYLGRQGDLQRHLNQMRAQYAAFYGVTSQAAMSPEEVRVWHEQVRGHQLGGYAPAGVYRLGEAGDEYVLSAPTTRAMERAIGHLSQSKILSMAGGAGGRLELLADIVVRADPAFGPDFAAEIKSDVRGEIVKMFELVTNSRPGAYRSS